MQQPSRHPLAALRASLGLSATAYLCQLNARHRRLGYGAMATRREKVARWEAGARPELTAQLAMADLHGVPAATVREHGWPAWLLAAFPNDRSVLDTPWGRLGTVISTRVADRGGAVDRRGFLIASGSALTGLAASWAVALDDEAAASGQGRRRITNQVVDHLDQRLDNLRHLDDVLGGGELTRAAESEFHMLSGLADDAVYDETTGRRLFATLAEAARLCGWLHFDAGHHAAAQTFYVTALRASAAAGVADVGANTLAFMAIQTYSVGNPHDAVVLAATALERIGTSATPRVRAMLLARTGRALSKTGDSDGAARYLDTSRATLASGPTEDDPAWSYWFTDSEIEMLAGSAALDLGEPAQALTHFHAARSAAYLADGYLRDGALFLARTAEAHLALGDIDQACAVAHDAWQHSTSLDSTRPSSALLSFRTRLKAHTGVPAAREFLDLTA
jgi:tetratricopeptide (TPR) repeat protein